MAKRNYRTYLEFLESGYGHFLEIFQKPGLFLKIHGLWLDFEEV
jgi:hypothetical protein